MRAGVEGGRTAQLAQTFPLLLGYWSGLPFPSPGDLPDPGIELQSRARNPSLRSGVLGTGLPGLGTEHLPGALCSGTGSPALGLCSP